MKLDPAHGVNDAQEVMAGQMWAWNQASQSSVGGCAGIWSMEDWAECSRWGLRSTHSCISKNVSDAEVFELCLNHPWLSQVWFMSFLPKNPLPKISVSLHCKVAKPDAQLPRCRGQYVAGAP